MTVFDIRYRVKIRPLQLLRASKFSSRTIRITALSSQSFGTFSHKFSAYISRRGANHEITDPYREDWSECAAITRGFSGPRNPTIDLVSSRMKQKAKRHRALIMALECSIMDLLTLLQIGLLSWNIRGIVSWNKMNMVQILDLSK